MSETALQKKLAALGACGQARDWVGDRSLTAAWAECERADWMLWLAAKAGVDRKLVVLTACACARTALVRVPAGEPLAAIETAERWARGEASIEDVRRAAYAATTTAASSASASAAYAADAAAAAAYTADAAAAAAYTADAAAAAAYAADAYASAAYAADAAAATAAYAADAYASAAYAAQRRMAQLVRERIPLRAVQVAMRGVR